MERMSKAEELEHLREMSPEAAAAWERERAHQQGTVVVAKSGDGIPPEDTAKLISLRRRYEDISLPADEREQARQAAKPLEERRLLRENPGATREWAERQLGMR
jgi:hypothetical protein